ncbi:MAG: abortive infection system antitoxin AbiGi family protein [Thermodesulfovibrionales bacterium]|nr:abortive infection system antitoxin AbiGi family protein [Thermodesulfovibrionales bacterium]
MTVSQDNGYISKHLIHWTGKGGEEEGADTLSKIASSCRLLLSYNRLHIFDLYHEIHEKMVCFTDVPLGHSVKHCRHYGKFGVAFHKLKLMNVGAQPVFYASHPCKGDLNVIFKFLQKEQVGQATIDVKLYQALHRHFYFIKQFSEGRADGEDTFYYEREWRLGEQTLIPAEKLNRPNPKWQARQEGYPPYSGRLETDGKEKFFGFDKDNVAFLVAPRNWRDKIDNPHEFPVFCYEDIMAADDAEL